VIDILMLYKQQGITLLAGGNCMKKRISSILAACIIITATAAFGANRAEQVSISPVIGGYTFDGRQHLDTNLVYGVRAGYNLTDNFGIEALFNYVKTEPTKAKDRVEMNRYGGQLLYHFIPDSTFVPYLAVGLSGLNFDAAGVDKKAHAAFDYGLGAKYFMSDRFALRGDVRHIIYTYSSQTKNNLEYTLGAYISFGSAKPAVKPVERPSAPAPAPAPVPVAEPAAPAPAPTAALTVTPATVTKSQSATLNWKSQHASACEIQPGIGPVPPQGVRVITPAVSTSFSLSCSGAGGTATTAAGVTVMVPLSPAPAPVSPKAAAAAKRFCSKPAILNIQFDTNKSDIKPQYEAELKNVGEFLQVFPRARGEISGHTDSAGSNEYNQKLSERRAESVGKHLIATFGIDPGRITTKGYGETKPIAGNKTKAGKTRNRRIEANFTCE
jgi:OOP family OmpA-OmpF porin